jgi:hypothetical protein
METVLNLNNQDLTLNFNSQGLMGTIPSQWRDKNIHPQMVVSGHKLLDWYQHP